MKPATNYFCHAACSARAAQMNAATEGKPDAGAESERALTRAFDTITAGLELVSARA